MELKNFKIIASFFTGLVVISIVSIFFTEYFSMREATLDMRCYMNIAADYAMTAVQDSSDNATIKESNGINKESYKSKEYYEYINTLKSQGMNTYCGICGELMYRDLASTPTFNTKDLDSQYIINKDVTSEVKYTPLSLNLPYISAEQLIDEYNYALSEMVYASNDGSGDGASKTKIVLANTNMIGDYTPLDNNFIVSGTMKSALGYIPNDVRNALPTDYVSSFDTGSIASKNGSFALIGMKVNTLSENLIRELYGNTDFLESTINILQNLNSAKYSDIRFKSTDGKIAVTNIPVYTISFYTDWYYVTQNLSLKIPVENMDEDTLFWNSSEYKTNTDDIDAINDNSITVYHADSSIRKGYTIDASKELAIQEGQLMFKVKQNQQISGVDIGIPYNVTKKYTLIG